MESGLFETMSLALQSEITSTTELVVLALTGLAAVGTLVASILDIAKTYLRIKPSYHRYKLRKFLFMTAGMSADTLEVFIWRASTGRRQSFYSQSMSQMIADIGHAQTRAFLDTTDTTHQTYISALTTGYDDPAQVKSLVLDEFFDPATTVARKKVLIGLIKDMIAANLRGFQIEASLRWKQVAQSFSVVLSIAIIYAIAVAAGLDITLHVLAYGLLGGLVAPFAHDLISKVEKPDKSWG